MLKKTWLLIVGMMAITMAGCGASVTSYVKPEAPWAAIKRVAVIPFNLPTENPVRRELMTHLFSQELRTVTEIEVVEVPLSSPLVSESVGIKKIGSQFQADAVFSGAVDETHGTIIHVRIQDAATEDLLWSGTYVLGTRAEFFTARTQQQQFQRGFRTLANQFAGEAS